MGGGQETARLTHHLPALVCAVAVGVMLVATQYDNVRLRAVGKVVAALSFLAYAWTMGAWQAGAPGRWVGFALILSAVGDVCLLSQRKGPLLGGIVAFGLAHLAFIGAFVALGFEPIGMFVAAVPMGMVAVAAWWGIARQAGSLKVPVLVYLLVISGMVMSAGGMVAWDASAIRLGLLACALVFAVSDVFVGLSLFVSKRRLFRMVGTPLYFGAQLGFAGLIAAA